MSLENEQIIKITTPLSKFNIVEEEVCRSCGEDCGTPWMDRCPNEDKEEATKCPGLAADCDGCSECEVEVELIKIPDYVSKDIDDVYYSEELDIYWTDSLGEQEATGEFLEKLLEFREAPSWYAEKCGHKHEKARDRGHKNCWQCDMNEIQDSMLEDKANGRCPYTGCPMTECSCCDDIRDWYLTPKSKDWIVLYPKYTKLRSGNYYKFA